MWVERRRASRTQTSLVVGVWCLWFVVCSLVYGVWCVERVWGYGVRT